MRGEFLDLADARLYYYAAGTRGAGDPVLFLHGFPTSGHLWSDVVPLIPAGHRLVILDLLGYGRSDRPLKRRVDIRAHATRTIAVMDELRITKACIVGHGLGGGIAQSLAVHHPDRVSHLCLVDSVAFGEWPTLEARNVRALLPIIRLLPPGVLTSVLKRDLLRGYSNHDHAAHSVDQYLRQFSSPDGRAALVAHVRALSSGETRDIAPRLASITAPTAIVWGQQDRVTPLRVGKKLAAMIPDATLDVIPGARHFTPEEAPRQVADAIGRLLQRRVASL